MFENGALISDRYSIVRCLGEGGMGKVYLAKDTLLDGDLVALKVLHPNYLSESVVMQRFLQEVRLTRKVSHKNVVRTYDVGRHEGLVFFTMEYVAGQSLLSSIEREEFNEQFAYSLAQQICHGLAAIHEAQIVHRDLKPDNILLLRDGVVKITDFGVARMESSHLTRQHQIIGSVSYLAPEIWQGEQPRAASDLYSFGVVLYEYCCKKAPFVASSVAAVMAYHISREPQSPKSVNPQVPDWLNNLILKLLKKDPAERPQSATAVLELLGVHQPSPSLPSHEKIVDSTVRKGLLKETIILESQASAPPVPQPAGAATIIEHAAPAGAHPAEGQGGRILMIDDDPDMVELVRCNITTWGYELESAPDGFSGLNMALANEYAMIILDLNLPRLHGMDVCKGIRQHGRKIPILMLTSRADEFDRVLGLELGADDYMVKPFSVRELVARVKALLRRAEYSKHGNGPTREGTRLRYSDLEIDLQHRKVVLNGQTVQLTPKQFELIVLLASEPGRTFSTRELAEWLWQSESTGGDDKLLVDFVERVRGRIERSPDNARFIKRVDGGYRFAGPEELTES